MSDDETSFRSTDAGDHVIVRVAGDLDLDSAPALTAELKRLVGPRPLILDLSAVDFMASSGLGVLVGAHKKSAAQAGALLLAAPGPRVRKIFRITKLHKVFAVFDSVEEAVAGLAKPMKVEAAPVETVVPGFGAQSPHRD